MRSLLLLIALLLLLPCLAAAKVPVVFKKAKFEHDAGSVTLTVGFREMFDAQLRRRLRSGFATTVVMRVWVHVPGWPQPIAQAARTLRAIYDLWDGRYRIQLEEPQRQRRFVEVTDQKRVVDLLTSFWRFPITRSANLRRGRRYRVVALIEVNPVDPEVLAELRRWLRRPYRSKPGRSGENFFGSFVSIFVNDRVPRAEKVFRLRTQPFYLPQ